MRIIKIQQKFFWFVLVLVVIFLSLLPQDRIFVETPFSDKADHFIAYFGLIFVALLSSAHKRPIWMILLGHIILGIGIEYVQSFVPGRYPEFLDVIANSLGVLGGALVYFLFRKLKPEELN